MIPFNPDIKFFDGDRRGYVLLQARPRRVANRPADGVDGLEAERAVSTFASFVVEDGQPGAKQV